MILSLISISSRSLWRDIFNSLKLFSNDSEIESLIIINRLSSCSISPFVYNPFTLSQADLVIFEETLPISGKTQHD